MKRAPRGFGPHLPGSLVLAALLVAVVVSRVAQPSRSDAAGALYSAGAAWRITAEGAAKANHRAGWILTSLLTTWLARTGDPLDGVSERRNEYPLSERRTSDRRRDHQPMSTPIPPPQDRPEADEAYRRQQAWQDTRRRMQSADIKPTSPRRSLSLPFLLAIVLVVVLLIGAGISAISKSGSTTTSDSAIQSGTTPLGCSTSLSLYDGIECGHLALIERVCETDTVGWFERIAAYGAQDVPLLYQYHDPELVFRALVAYQQSGVSMSGPQVTCADGSGTIYLDRPTWLQVTREGTEANLPAKLR